MMGKDRQRRQRAAVAKVGFSGSYVFLKPEAEGMVRVRQYLLPLLPPAVLEEGKAKVTNWHCTVMFSKTEAELDKRGLSSWIPSGQTAIPSWACWTPPTSSPTTNR